MARAAAQGAYGEVYRGFVVGRLPCRLHPRRVFSGPRASMGNRMTTLLERTPTQVRTDCRIDLRQPINGTGSIDGAWWPHSKDLAAELAALFDVLGTAGRAMTGVIYNFDSCDRAPRKMQIAGQLVRTSGYHYGIYS